MKIHYCTECSHTSEKLSAAEFHALQHGIPMMFLYDHIMVVETETVTQ